MNLTDIRDIRALQARHGFRFSKSMGQNFLIAELEIGPGVGCLTQQLAHRAGRVAAIELDSSLLPILRETLANCPNVEIISGDVMKLELSTILFNKFPDFTVKACANLPYNITTPVLTRLLESGCFQSITVMIQKEVARRI